MNHKRTLIISAVVMMAFFLSALAILAITHPAKSARSIPATDFYSADDFSDETLAEQYQAETDFTVQGTAAPGWDHIGGYPTPTNDLVVHGIVAPGWDHIEHLKSQKGKTR